MILLGCLLAFGLSVAPRFFLVLAWLFSDRWNIVWHGDFLVPLLGIIFLPYTTIMYMLTWTMGGLQGWELTWIIMGLLLDLSPSTRTPRPIRRTCRASRPPAATEAGDASALRLSGAVRYSS